MAVGGVNVRRWLTARQAAEELPKDGMAHGDFYFRNVLDTTSGVQVVDWEFAGPAPHFTDHLRFWSTLKSDEDADLALSLILRNRSSEERNAIGILGRWLAYRLLGENITVRRRFQNPADLTHARAGVGRGERLYAETR